MQGGLANDDFGSAILIAALPFTVAQDTTKATVASDDPDMGAGAGVNSNTVWYRVVAPSSGGMWVNTLDSDYDTVLAAFTGSRGNLSVIASNDDSSPSVLQSEMAFNVQAGQTYYLEVAQYGEPGGGTLRLRVELGAFVTVTPTATPLPTYTTWYWSTETPGATDVPSPTPTPGVPPANDDFGSAISIGSFPFSHTEDTTGAAVASDDPNMGEGSGANSNTVWYRLVAPATGSIQADTLGSDYDTVLAVFTGSRGNLTLVASNDDVSPAVQSQVVFNVQAGVTYYLEVAQYGASAAGGQLQLTVSFSGALVTGTPTVVGTPLATTGTPGPAVLGAMPPPIPPPLRAAGTVSRDTRYFSETGYRVNLDPFWDYFQKRGGVRTFGYPISWEFPLMWFNVQFFQRGILQLMPDGSVATMNLLDEGLMPYSRIGGSSFPAPERELIDTAPSPSDPAYAEKAIAFLQAYVPDQWDGMPVNFLTTFLDTVRYEDAFPEGDGEPELVPMLNLELWGLPTSHPALDPNNNSFVYQRFQRGILMYDASTGATQGLLLADYLKSIMTGERLPADLAAQAQGSKFYRQYDSSRPGYLARPTDLPGTNLQGAFETALP